MSYEVYDFLLRLLSRVPAHRGWVVFSLGSYPVHRAAAIYTLQGINLTYTLQGLALYVTM